MSEKADGELRIGLTFTAIALVLLSVALAGVAPHVIGGVAGKCSDEPPHPIFLIAWGAAALLGTACMIFLSTAKGKPKGPPLRRATFWVSVLVVIGAVALFLWTVTDGISECGF